MPAISISINTTAGGQKVAKLLKVVEPKTLLTAIGGRLLFYVNKQFKTHGEGKWRPLSSLTLALRKRGGNQPLRDTGHLSQSFVADSGGPGTDYTTDDQTYVEVGSNVKYAKVHEYGAVIEAKIGKFWQYV